MTGPARCPASRNGEHVEDLTLYGSGFCALCAASIPAPAVPSGDTADEPCLGYDSDGVPDGRCANCGVTRGEHVPSGDTADTCTCGEFDCEACIENREAAGTAAATECSDPHCSSFPGVCRDARHHEAAGTAAQTGRVTLTPHLLRQVVSDLEWYHLKLARFCRCSMPLNRICDVRRRIIALRDAVAPGQ